MIGGGHRARLLPWAWGINGFGSVLAAPLALLVAMSFGYHVVAALALALYFLAALVFASLPSAESRAVMPDTG